MPAEATPEQAPMAGLAKLGFSVHESVNSHIPEALSFPQVVRHRYRKAEGTWPCYQIGLGIFTTNQVNDGYEWGVFKGDILRGLQILDEHHPKHLAGLPNFGIDLRYQDGFLLSAGESTLSFLRDKMDVGFKLPTAFMDSSLLDANSAPQCMLAFNLGVTVPQARIIGTLAPGFINGLSGFILDTVVQSHGDLGLPRTIDALDKWLEQAHAVHQHAFKTLINPAFARTFN